MRDARLYLQDILDSIDNIREYITDMDFETFTQDRKTQDAAARNLEIIGEAASQLQEDIKDKHLEIPWYLMKGLRNVLAHEYFGVRLVTIWETICGDLPKVQPLIQKLISELG